jgi:dihydrofolate synthase / folylpolyglutamate synthase
MRLDSIDAAVKALYKHVPQTVSMKKNYNLDRMRQFLTQIGDPQDTRQIIHVTGTSGKTSTAYFIRALLQEAGQLTGLTISPHIVSVTERVQIDGRPLPDRDFLDFLEQFFGIVEDSEVPLTYFEVLVAFAYWVFAERGVDYAVVETGLGGLLDGTNTVTRADKLCVITDLGLDHTEVLGATIEEISWQKAGIIQPHNQVCLLEQDAAAVHVVVEHAKRQDAPVLLIRPDHDDLVAADLPLFQRRNWALAYAVYEYLTMRDGLQSLAEDCLKRAALAQPPGRFERYRLGGKTLILDGAHNPQKLAALRETLRASGVFSAAVLANFVTAPDHKLASALAELRPFAAHLIVPSFTVIQDLAKQSPPAEEMAACAKRAGFDSVEVCDDLNNAFSALLGRPEQVLLVTGSLYLVSQVRMRAEARGLFPVGCSRPGRHVRAAKARMDHRRGLGLCADAR